MRYFVDTEFIEDGKIKKSDSDLVDASSFKLYTLRPLKGSLTPGYRQPYGFLLPIRD